MYSMMIYTLNKVCLKNLTFLANNKRNIFKAIHTLSFDVILCSVGYFCTRFLPNMPQSFDFFVTALIIKVFCLVSTPQQHI